jgi:hypothetical protein
MLSVVATPTPDGRTLLRFTPKVEYGDVIREPRPSPDRSEWVLEVGRRSRAWPDLGWEVALAPNQYLVIGANFEREGTLGHRAFVHREGRFPIQHLLVLRTSRPGAGVDAEIADPAAHRAAAPDAPLPLALQAAISARASGR